MAERTGRDLSAVPRIVQLDTQIVSNPSGSLASITPRLTLTPVNLELGAGFGTLQLAQFPGSLAFVSPSAGFSVRSDRADVFVNGAVAIIPPGENTGAMRYGSFGAGTAFVLFQSPRGITVRAGADASAFNTLADSLRHPVLGGGASVSGESYAVYAIVRGVIAPTVANRQLPSEMAPQYAETRAGTVLAVFEGTDLTLELAHSLVEVTGKAGVSFEGQPLRGVLLSFTDRNPSFGSPTEFMATVIVAKERTPVRASFRMQSSFAGTGGNRQLLAQGEPNFDAFRNVAISSGSLADLARRYQNAPLEEKIRAASALAYLAMRQVDPSVLSASPLDQNPGAGRSADETYAAFRSLLIGNPSLPPGVCGDIHGMAAEFLRLMGVEAYTAAVSGQGTGHIIAVALDRNSGRGYSIDYDRVLSVSGPDIQSVLSSYGRDRGEPIVAATVYGGQNRFVAHYVTNEGRLIQAAISGRGEQDDGLRDSLARRRRQAH